MILDSHTGLVLEGGGMRGVFTAGALDFLMDKKVYFPYTIGVSAGACNGLSYASRQRGRAKRCNIDIVSTSEISISCLILRKDLDKAVQAIHDEFFTAGEGR